MSWSIFRDVRTWLVAGALLATLLALLVPRLTLKRDVYDVLVVLDITTSMNARDVARGDKPIARIDAAKDAVRELLAKLPCGSRLGLGIFTERRTFLLFDPVDTCADFAALDEAIGQLTWRMAWEADSYITKGFYSAIDIAKSLKADLIFISDGHELPPLPFSGLPPFDGKPGDVRGLVVGIGSRSPSPLPKYDDDGREIGTYAEQEVPQENRSGPPPPDAASRPGYHPKWAPFGNAVVNNNEHLAFVREKHLQDLAAVTGLSYAYLGNGRDLMAPLMAAARPRALAVATDVSAVPGGIALVLLTAVFGIGLAGAVRALRPSFSTTHP
jgi:mxaL protein